MKIVPALLVGSALVFGPIPEIEGESQEVRRVTTHEAMDYHPQWTPDGTRLFFTSQRGGRPGIWQVPSSGGTPMPFETNLSGDFHFSFSPDGSLIAFDARAGFRRAASGSPSPRSCRAIWRSGSSRSRMVSCVSSHITMQMIIIRRGRRTVVPSRLHRTGTATSTSGSLGSTPAKSVSYATAQVVTISLLSHRTEA